VDEEATVLIVDDHPGFRRFARKLLEAGGLHVIEASDGLDAVASAARLRPELVLLDIQLPGLDGFEVAARLAAIPEHPVVVLTSSRDLTDYGDRIESALAAGFLPKAEVSLAALAPFLRSRL
jgi:CheY-like chemotaxis protein